jgi:predicted permease
VQPAVISHASWKQRFAGRADIIGHAVRLGSQPYTIIGVLPESFSFAPVGLAEVFVLPPKDGAMVTRRNLHWIQVIARLKQGVTPARAFEEMTAISRHLAEIYPQANGGTGVHITPLRDVIIGPVRPILLLLFAAAGAVLILGCANVANVLLAKSSDRRDELAIRLALGAERRTLARQMLVESIFLAFLAGVLSMLMSRLAVVGLLSSVPASVVQDMPFLRSINQSVATVLFTGLSTLVAGIAVGLVTLTNIPLRDPQKSLSESGRSRVGGQGRLRSVLVVGEIGIAGALLMVSGVLLQTVWRVIHVDPGFNRHNLLLLSYALPPDSYDKRAQVRSFQQQIETKVSAVPGVLGVAEVSILPLSDCNGCNTNRFAVEGKPLPQGAVQPEAASRGVSQGYFGVLQAHLLKGRVFEMRDYADNAAPVVVVNRALQSEYFDGDAVGKHLTFTFAPGQPPREVVGVVEDIKEGFLDMTDRPALYTPMNPGLFGNVLVRTAVDTSSVVNPIRAGIQAVERNIALYDIMTMDDRVANSTTMFLRNLPAMLMTWFGTLSLLIAGIGIYGVVSYSVAQRTREFGMRMALGASPGDILRLVLSGVLRLSLVGIGSGIFCGALLAKAAATLFFNARMADFASFALAPVAIAAVALIAGFVPAQRAADLDPMDALRRE